MTKEEAAAAEEQKEPKTEEKKEDTKEAGESSEQKEEGDETKAEGEEGAENEGKDGEDKNKGVKRGRKWPWSKKGASAGGNVAPGTAATEGEGGEEAEGPPAEPEKPPPTDQEIEQELNKRMKELTSEKNQLHSRIELYKKVQNLEQDVTDMRGELDSLKEARGLPTSSEANKPYALRPGR